MNTTVVVGGGCSGALTAIHLSKAGERIVLVDPAAPDALGRGAAYRTTDPTHLLNSRAAAMSALADAPTDFVDWCRDQGLPIGPTDFAPRAVFGDYLHDRLSEVGFEHVRGVAIRLEDNQERPSVILRGGQTVAGDRVVLALGHGAPAGPLSITSAVRTHPYYVGNPWTPGALDRVPGDVPVLLIGTGLTALDVAMSLSNRGRRAPLHAVSRRGLLPQPHLEIQPKATGGFAHDGTDAGGLLRAVRRYAATEPDWRCAVDTLRPQLDQLWWQLSVDARRRFLQHVAAYWEVHRHRMAPTVANRVTALRDSGALFTHAAAIHSIRRGERGFVVTLRFRNKDESWPVGAIVNCTGPGGAATSTLGRALLDDGLARRDPTGTGLDVDGHGRLVDRDGGASDRVVAIGPTRRGAWWETTAVPEIRTQAAALARVPVAA
ncbi:FAD/NAD(P)-binding protein [Dactylosporangium siamense]|uniref:FAD/NAD(P)-binding protein n=1 Tax=Dactylosporangium siamense TaxID=685454 RepID=UPI0023B3599D|nr:FAD/NAD(P)-binding protein [Dactylosporangium siamense]